MKNGFLKRAGTGALGSSQSTAGLDAYSTNNQCEVLILTLETYSVVLKAGNFESKNAKPILQEVTLIQPSETCCTLNISLSVDNYFSLGV